MASTQPNETHAALALANQPILKDFVIRVRYRNEQQLRTPTPNGWESFWIFTNYTVDSVTKKKKTNYIAFKPGGIELGTAFDELGQTFLYTNNAVAARSPVGQTFETVITKVGQHIEATMGGVRVMTFDGAKDRTLYDVAGQVGMYTEDARVRVYSVQAQ